MSRSTGDTLLPRQFMAKAGAPKLPEKSVENMYDTDAVNHGISVGVKESYRVFMSAIELEKAKCKQGRLDKNGLKALESLQARLLKQVEKVDE